MPPAKVADVYILPADIEEATSYLSAIYGRVTPCVERFTHGFVGAKRVKYVDFLSRLSNVKSEVRHFLHAVVEVEADLTRRSGLDSARERAAFGIPLKFFGGGEDDVVLDDEDARDCGEIVNAVDDEIAAEVGDDGQKGDTLAVEDVVCRMEKEERQKARNIDESADMLNIPDEVSVTPAPFETSAEPTSSPMDDDPSPRKKLPPRPPRSSRRRTKKPTSPVANPGNSPSHVNVEPALLDTLAASTSSPKCDEPSSPRNVPPDPRRSLKRRAKDVTSPVAEPVTPFETPGVSTSSHKSVEPTAPRKMPLGPPRPLKRIPKGWKPPVLTSKKAKIASPEKLAEEGNTPKTPSPPQSEVPPEPVSPIRLRLEGAVKRATTRNQQNKKWRIESVAEKLAVKSVNEPVKKPKVTCGAAKADIMQLESQMEVVSPTESVHTGDQGGSEPTDEEGDPNPLLRDRHGPSTSEQFVAQLSESEGVVASGSLAITKIARKTKMSPSSDRPHTSSAQKTAASQGQDVQQKPPGGSSPTLLVPGLHGSSDVDEAVSSVPEVPPETILDTSPPPSPSGVFRKPLKKRPLPLEPTPTESTTPVKRARLSTAPKTAPGAGELSQGVPSNARSRQGTPGMVGPPSPAFFHQPWMPHHGTATTQQMGPRFGPNQGQFGTPQQTGPGFGPNQGQFGPHMGPFARPGIPSPGCINQGVSYSQNNMKMGPSTFFGAGPSHGPQPGAQQLYRHPGGYQGFHSQQPQQHFQGPGQQQQFICQGGQNGGFWMPANFGPHPQGPVFVHQPSPSAWNHQQTPHFSPVMVPDPRQHVHRDPSPLSEFGGVARCHARQPPPAVNCPVRHLQQPRFPVPMMAPSMQGRRVLLPTPSPTPSGAIHGCQTPLRTPTPSAPERRHRPSLAAPGKSLTLKPGQSRPATPAGIDSPHASSPMTYPSQEPCQPLQNVVSPMIATAGSSPNGSASMGVSSTDP